MGHCACRGVEKGIKERGGGNFSGVVHHFSLTLGKKRNERAMEARWKKDSVAPKAIEKRSSEKRHHKTKIRVVRLAKAGKKRVSRPCYW